MPKEQKLLKNIRKKTLALERAHYEQRRACVDYMNYMAEKACPYFVEKPDELRIYKEAFNE